jgi:hypothetical protein
MTQNQNIQSRESLDVAPTPQNTPLDTAVLANRPANLGRPQVEDIGEGEDEDEGEDVGGMNPASLLAQVCRLVFTRTESCDSSHGARAYNLEPCSSRTCSGQTCWSCWQAFWIHQQLARLCPKEDRRLERYSGRALQSRV